MEWRLRFQEADLDIIHIDTLQNFFADIISSWCISESPDAGNTYLAVQTSAIFLNAIEVGEVNIKVSAASMIASSAQKSPEVWEKILKKF